MPYRACITEIVTEEVYRETALSKLQNTVELLQLLQQNITNTWPTIDGCHFTL
jgi:hypothetical protein